MDHHHTAAGLMLVTSVVGAAGSIINTIIGALPEIVSACRGCSNSSRDVLCNGIKEKTAAAQKT